MKTRQFLILSAIALAVPAAHAATIFSHTFDGGAVDLNETSPDTGSEDWVATPNNFLADGSIGGTAAGTATLGFTPANGLVYTLDASFTSISGGGQWIALGFVKGQSTSNDVNNTVGDENRFLEGGTTGVAWMMARGDNSSNANRAFLGTASVGNDTGTAWGGGPTDGGNIDMRVVLDTTGGAGNWTASWFAKRDTDGSYTQVGDLTNPTLLSEDIDSVGFARLDDGISGNIESFSLTSIPEPSSALLSGLGMLALALLRRRR